MPKVRRCGVFLAEHDLLGIPGSECSQLPQGSFDSHNGVGSSRLEDNCLAIRNGPIECCFANINADVVMNVHKSV